MISRKTATEVAARVQEVRAVRDCDFPTAKELVAAERGCAVSTINRYMRKARRAQEFEGTVIRPNFIQTCPVVPTTEPLDVMVIGDAHDAPSLNKDRFEWLGNHATGDDAVIQIGDFATFDSLCRYIDNGSHEAWTEKTTFADDLASLDEALAAFNRGLGGWTPRVKHITLGNHEDRVFSFADRHPEIYGMMVKALYETFEKHGWTYSRFGDVYYLGGVGFVHVPLNQMGKPYGGKNAETNIANDTTTDLVIGHSHKHREHTAPKIGPNQFVRIINVGCALPEGHVERYASHSTTGWTYGVADLTLRDNHIADWRWTSMATLENVYG